MKKLLALALTLVTLQTFSQGTNLKSWSLCIDQNQTKTVNDSVAISCTLSCAPDSYKSITFTYVANGPVITIPTPTVTYLTGISATAKIVFKTLPVGTYTFTATGVSSSGVTGSVTSTVVVNNPPPGRALTGGTIQVVNGVITIIPTYSDAKP